MSRVIVNSIQDGIGSYNAENAFFSRFSRKAMVVIIKTSPRGTYLGRKTCSLVLRYFISGLQVIQKRRAPIHHFFASDTISDESISQIFMK